MTRLDTLTFLMLGMFSLSCSTPPTSPTKQSKNASKKTSSASRVSKAYHVENRLSLQSIANSGSASAQLPGPETSPVPLTGTFRTAYLDESRNSKTVRIYLGNVSKETVNASNWVFEDREYSHLNGPSADIPARDLDSEAFENLNLENYAGVIATSLPQPYYAKRSNFDHVELARHYSEGDPEPNADVWLIHRLNDPEMSKDLQKEVFAIGYTSKASISPFHPGTFRLLFNSASPPGKIDQKSEKEIFDRLREKKALTGTSEKAQGPFSPETEEFHYFVYGLGSESDAKIVYAFIGSPMAYQIGDAKAQPTHYLVAVVVPGKVIDFLAVRTITSSYSTTGAYLYGGYILKDGRFLMFLSAEDGWNCPEVLILNRQGESERTMVSCIPSDC